MNKKDHPQGLPPEEREEWHNLCKRLFFLYNKMPMGTSERKILAGCDEEENGSILMFFKGSKVDLFALIEILAEYDINSHQNN